MTKQINRAIVKYYDFAHFVHTPMSKTSSELVLKCFLVNVT